MLILFVTLYLLASIAMGLWFARRVHNSADYAVAGRALPLSIIFGTTFATWFGSETVIGIPARFLESGLHETAEDPWGASLCLILVGLFFSRRLYKLSLLTINDYYRERYGVAVELFCSAVSVVSYLGWVAAQISALGIVFSLLTEGAVSPIAGACIGSVVVLFYTIFGGMWSVAVTDFVQMIVIVVCLTAIAWIAGNLAGGVSPVLEAARGREMLHLLPPLEPRPLLFFLASGITIMLGSIPQQDIFQRVMSAKNADVAVIGPILGGVAYLGFSFIPMFIVATGFLLMPDDMGAMIERDPQQVLPTLIMGHMPEVTKVLFFGALLSAIMSTASSTILAPSTVLVQNVLKHLRPQMSDHEELALMRVTVFAFTLLVLGYSIAMQGTSVYELVSNSYQVPLVGAFVPLVCGLYWKRASNGGAVTSILLGLGTWLLFMATSLGQAFPQQLAGLIMAGVGMWLGSIFFTTSGGAEPRPTAGGR
ncbi:Sodium/glucose cotransporter [Pirellulimonas nuda]|uniref:Sodium/glucose cotransporter n=1 Tax=Pirellulimonas nuda TaxID=2528009 RepID=A0A518D992_9BACT|nr:sodium:solute symporter family protein [Pirellulimonas nuda]QDU88041.1 Sodium/glucose cotransporter [Pirellulimonas nuda]